MPETVNGEETVNRKDSMKKDSMKKEGKPSITYYVQRYRPAYEAISKEVHVLADFFSRDYRTAIYNLHLDGLFSFSWEKIFFSQHFAWYPLTFPHAHMLSRKSTINHIYTSLGDLPYLPILQRKNTVLTAAASASLKKVGRRAAYLQQLPAIIVESEKQKNDLRLLGIPEKSVQLIYPPVDLEKFYPFPASSDSTPSAPSDINSASSYTFTILYASCPTREKDFAKRGIYLLREAAKHIPDVSFLLAWRTYALAEAKKIFDGAPSVMIRDEIAPDMNLLYAQAHCTIIPYTEYDDYLKLIPNSALESLAAGKPLLASSRTEIAAIVQKEKCGVVFEPTPESLCRSVAILRENYQYYQKNCRRVAEKYFSKDRFLHKYEMVYKKLLPVI